MTPLKLNQTVYHLLHGWEGKVVAVQMQEDFPLCIQSGQDPANVGWYTMDGKMFAEDVNPTWVAEPPKPYESRKGCLCLPKILSGGR